MNVYFLIFCISVLIFPTHEVGEFTFYNWKFHFPPGSSMGLFLALAIPLDIPNKSVYVAYNFEANYLLPYNVTQDVYPPIIERNSVRSGDKDEKKEAKDNNVIETTKTKKKMFKGVDRKLIYDAMESKLESHGYKGRPCLLRLICETALHSITETNGVLGNIFHVVFTPSTSINNGIDLIYEKAEVHGATVNNCDEYKKNCTVSFLDLISWMENSNN
ncbi:uncharacterized protein [Onthophagus taurus]|uniref:uncharacterized protein n=1 Tax=Onthophagus taurus TaxID=166361 RepID=UPI000C203E51|nr:uncharacterized protein LOC111414197 [Onthophagus taurus]